MATVGFLVLCVPLLVVGMILPQFSDVFHAFGVSLPWLTCRELQCAQAVSSPIGVILVLAAMLLAAFWASGRRERAMWFLVLAIALTVLVHCFAVVGMYAPLTGLIESLQRGKS